MDVALGARIANLDAAVLPSWIRTALPGLRGHPDPIVSSALDIMEACLFEMEAEEVKFEEDARKNEWWWDSFYYDGSAWMAAYLKLFPPVPEALNYESNDQPPSANVDFVPARIEGPNIRAPPDGVAPLGAQRSELRGLPARWQAGAYTQFA